MKIQSILFYLFTFFCCDNICAQQYAHLQLSTVGSDDYIIVNEESLLNEGKVTKEDVLLEEGNAGENIRLNFSIEDPIDGTDDYSVKLANPGGSEYYGYKITAGEIMIADHLGVVLLTSNPGNGYSLEVIRCDSTIFYVHENKVIFCREFQGSFSQLNAVVHVDIANYTNIDVAIETPEDCIYICEQIKEQYLVIEEFIDWREHVLTDSLIKFKYVEKYSIAESYNDFIQCQLFDNHNNLLFSSNLSNQYGLNLQSWLIPEEYLNTDAHYVLRVSGMNKGNLYNVRIRYDGD